MTVRSALPRLLVALLALLLLAPGVHADPTFPTTTQGDDKHLVETVTGEVERAAHDGGKFVDAYLRNFEECMLEDNPDCGL